MAALFVEELRHVWTRFTMFVATLWCWLLLWSRLSWVYPVSGLFIYTDGNTHKFVHWWKFLNLLLWKQHYNQSIRKTISPDNDLFWCWLKLVSGQWKSYNFHAYFFAKSRSFTTRMEIARNSICFECSHSSEIRVLNKRNVLVYCVLCGFNFNRNNFARICEGQINKH